MRTPCLEYAHFYPRPLRGGRHLSNGTPAHGFAFLSTPSARRATTLHLRQRRGIKIFLSTPSARRATFSQSDAAEPVHHFYPRPPRGGRHSLDLPRGAVAGISIHALREEGDPVAADKVATMIRISIHALREEGDQNLCWCRKAVGIISIHALREEGDHPAYRAGSPVSYFYPRPPRGGRLRMASPINFREIPFLSTPSARRATTRPPSRSRRR